MSATAQITNADAIGELGGPFGYAGGSVGTVGPTGTAFWGNSGCAHKLIVGADVGREASLSPEVEVHFGQSNTSTVTFFNVSDVVNSVGNAVNAFDNAVNSVGQFFGL